jgi:Mn-dependent DtxR family transcriptional regulator
VAELASRLPVGRPAVSKHLRVLGDAGLVEHSSAGTRNFYVLAPGGLATAQQWLVRTWDSALAAYADEAAALAKKRRSHPAGDTARRAQRHTGRAR